MENKTRVKSYDLEQAITSEDDPLLWEAALCKHWPPSDDPSLLVDSLRFGTGRLLKDDETAENEADIVTSSQRALVSVVDWHFTRTDEGILTSACFGEPGPVPPVILPGISFMNGMPGLTMTSPYVITGPVVFQYLTISRPSSGVEEAVIYCGSTAPGVGEGSTYIWKKNGNKLWEQTDTCLNRWFT